jgi:hypothetical protein
MDRLIAAAEKIGEPKAGKKTPAKKRAAKPNATDQVLKNINRSN